MKLVAKARVHAMKQSSFSIMRENHGIKPFLHSIVTFEMFELWNQIDYNS
jgi:hypothetical protein